jgi:site-specific recombinase XerD
MTSTDLATVTTVTQLATLAPLVDSANGYAAESKAANTRRGYEGDFARFAAWCSSKGLASLPANPGTVAVYLAALADEGRKVATLERALAGIVAAQRAGGVDWPKGHRVIRDTLAGIRRRLGVAPSKKAPVLGTDLAAMVAPLGTDLAGLRDRALLTLGWFGAFRRSELVALDVTDIERTREGVIVTVRRSKTDQEGEGSTKGIPYAGNPALCPVRALEAYLAAAAVTQGPIFRAVDRHGNLAAEGLNGRTVARIVQRAAELAGLDASRVSGHSLRAGFATTAAKAGRSLDSIMRQTGHRSERVARGYIRTATVFDGNAAAGLV